MLLAILGILIILSSLKAFTTAGIPLDSKRNLTGTPAKVFGVFCVMAGLAVIVIGIAGDKILDLMRV